MHKLSACVITYNDEHTVAWSVSSVRWADEIVVVDTGSTDRTKVRDAPDGVEGEGVVLRTIGTRPDHPFEPRDHVDLLEPAGAIDLARAAKVSGARFAYLKGEGALLELALVRYAIDVAMAHGHTPVIPPVLVRESAMYGTGFLPTDEQQLFMTRDDDLYLVGTSEVPLAALHMDELLDEDDLPLRYVGYSPCFRREAGAHGKDTRGILRVHQFEKVELFSFVHPDEADAEHERILAIEEEIFTGLGIHARVVDIPVGDLGASAARKFDIEAWLPGQDAYREVTSCSNTTDYQSRRLRTRIKVADGDNVLVHTLNGTALAVQRAIIALVETHQRADGSVAVPEALVPHLGELFGQLLRVVGHAERQGQVPLVPQRLGVLREEDRPPQQRVGDVHPPRRVEQEHVVIRAADVRLEQLLVRVDGKPCHRAREQQLCVERGGFCQVRQQRTVPCDVGAGSSSESNLRLPVIVTRDGSAPSARRRPAVSSPCTQKRSISASTRLKNGRITR